MRVNGTIHKRNFDGVDRWYFLEELPYDMFIGVFIPNDDAIKRDGKLIMDKEVKDWFEDNSVANAEPLWYRPNEDKPWIEDFTHIDIKKGFRDDL